MSETEDIQFVDNPNVVDVEAFWNSRSLLSLDGGGIRGYWSLLMLEELMNKIEVEERKYRQNGDSEEDDFDGLHSFFPEPWPKNVSHRPYEPDEEDELRRASSNDTTAECRALKPSRRFLPCHYFDYIFGSSTGALIAIMLGRFRMAVSDCLREYETVGSRVFGRPRFFTQIRFGIIHRPKFRESDLEDVVREVIGRRCEKRPSGGDHVTFHVKYWEDLCRTCVTTNKSAHDRRAETLYLLRSYDNYKKTASTSRLNTLLNGPTRASTTRSGISGISQVPHKQQPTAVERNLTSKTNYGQASTLHIWEIARAATAAPFFFKPLKIKPGGKEMTVFEDGGFGACNNPTMEAIWEIEKLHGPRSVGVVVSVGTARRDHEPGKGTLPTIQKIGDKATDPETVHLQVQRLLESEKYDFEYFRLNAPGLLDIPFDEWKPKLSRKSFTKERKRISEERSGKETLKKMKTNFSEWLRDNRNQQSLERCAHELVRRRRARTSNPTRWEHFATGAVYRCQEHGQAEDCGREFRDKARFKNHFVEQHNCEEGDIREPYLRRCRTCFEYQEPT